MAFEYDIDVPDFYTDPKFEESQEFLFPYGKDILQGRPDPYFAPIGEIGGETFEDYMASIRGDVTRGVTEDLARRKVRGMRGGDIISKAMGKITPALKWEEMLRGLKGREFLFTQGRGITEGVRSAGLEFGRQKSAFGLQKAGLEFNIEKQARADEAAEKAAKDKMWTDIISSVIGGVGTAAKAYANPAGTATKLGSAAVSKGPFQGAYDLFA